MHGFDSAMKLPGPLFLYPSHLCNYECSYCYTLSGPGHGTRHFLEANCGRLLVDAAQIGFRDIRFSGGEPLLLRDLQAHCEFIKQNGMIYSISTNGALLE